jgi:two-component system response regulator YesN
MKTMSALGNDPVRTMNLDQAMQAADHFSRACDVPCRVINALGETLYMAAQTSESTAVCVRAGIFLPGARTNEAGPVSIICDNAHLYGCYQAERFGGRYVYFCPLGLTHWASPIMVEGSVVGALIGGPVHMVEPDEFLIDEIVIKNGIHPDHLPDLQKQIRKVPVMSTERVNSLSELLHLTAGSLSDDSFAQLEQKKGSADLQAELCEQIKFLKSYALTSDAAMAYPIEKERQLLEFVEAGDKSGSQTVLNEILGHIFFASSGSIQVIQARVIELVVLLSRAAIKGGADVSQIFGLNFTCLNKINAFRNIDEIAYWLSGIMARFTDQVFNLTNVKHADVIYQAVDYIKKNYMKRITLEEVAAHVYLSPAYFSRVFKDEIGENFNIYVNLIRIDMAKKILVNEKVSLTDISMMVGFDGQSYFSKVFKKTTGVTPNKYRESRGKVKPQIASA